MRLGAVRHQLVNSSVGAIPLGVGIGVGCPDIEKVGDVDRPVRPLRHIGRVRPCIADVEELAA